MLRRATSLGAAWLAALLGPVGGCSAPTPFACAGDGQCRLDGAAGVCTEQGHCAYPDDDCDSGLRYPPGVAGGLAGQCAEGDPPAATIGSDSNSGTTSTSSTTEPPPTTEPVTTFPGTTEPDPSTSTGDPGGGSTSQGGLCPDPSANDDPFNLDQIPLVNCSALATGEFDEDGGEDWHLFVGPDDCFGGGFGTLIVSVDEPALLCAYLDCPAQSVVCGDEAPLEMEAGFVGCCSQTQPVLLAPFGCEPNGELRVRVGPLDEEQACFPYTVTVTGP